MGESDAEQIRAALAEVYRAESRRVFATLIRLLGDFDLAEEALHDAFAAAAEQWPATACPPIRARGSSRPAVSKRSTRCAAGRGSMLRCTISPLGSTANAKRRQPRRGRRDRRRPAAADFHLLPPRAGRRARKWR